jgi:hypothetical protein
MESPLDIHWLESGLGEVPSLDFFGSGVQSPNRLYTLLWQDSDPSRRVGGFRTAGEGSYRLLQGRKLLSHGHMPRPNDGKVADTGIFIFNDWGFGSGLHGTFRAFTAEGEEFFHRTFRSNLYNNGLALDGSLAVSQLCYGPNQSGGTLMVFDLREQRLIAQWVPDTGWAERYTFEPALGQIGLVYPNGTTVTYTLKGQCLDRGAWEQAQVASGSGFMVLDLAQRKLLALPTPAPPEVTAEIHALLDSAWDRLAEYPAFRAKVERFRGELAEACGDPAIAIAAYQRALQLDPQVGVKRRLVSLLKRESPRDGFRGS